MQYKAQNRPCLEYGSHLWRGASKHSLATTLDAIQKRAIKLIGDPGGPNQLTRLPGSPKNHFCPFPVLQILPWCLSSRAEINYPS